MGFPGGSAVKNSPATQGACVSAPSPQSCCDPMEWAPRLLCQWELPFPSPEDLPDPGIEFVSPALAGRFFTAEPPGKPM